MRPTAGALLIGLGVWLAAAAKAALGAEERTATIWWRGVEEFARAQVDNSLSAKVNWPARAGGLEMPAIFLHPRSEGRAVATFPALSLGLAPGVRVFWLGYAGISDGVPWDDKQHPADGVRFYVAVDGQEVAAAHVRQSRWVPLAAQLYEAPEAGQHTFRASLSLATDAGPEGNSNYDWALFGDPMVVALLGEPLAAGTPVAGVSGVVVVQAGEGGGTVVVEGLDAGGAPVAGAVQRLEVPAGIKLTFTRFDFSAHPQCAAWRWRSEGIKVPAAWGGSWQPRLTLESCVPLHAVALAGEHLRVQVTVRNAGPGTVLPSHQAYAQCGAERQPIERLEPGGRHRCVFDLGVQREGQVAFRAVAHCGTAEASVESAVTVWPALPALPTDRPRGVRLQQLGTDFLLLENPACRWLFYKKAAGLEALVWVWCAGKWELAGSVGPWLTLAFGSGGGWYTPDLIAVRAQQTGTGVELSAQTEPLQGVTCVLTATLSAQQPAMKVSLTAEARGQAAELAALLGPAVHAGDRSTGAAKGLAIFPGLEFLEAEEHSSSERDLAPPLNERWTPHKFKICVPMMMVETRSGGPVVAVMWDARQKWDGEHMAPAATFASPDFLTGRESHLMQLSLPSVPDFAPENTQRAIQPLRLEPGKPWRLVQYLVAGKPEPDATAALAWFDELIGYPEAEAWPRSFAEEMALCRQGFLVTTWDAEHQKSRHVVGGGSANAPGFATLMLMDARAVAQGEDKAKLLERVQLIGEQTVREQGPAGLASGACCHIMAWEFPYHWGHLPAALAGMQQAAYEALNSQEEDGGWGYYPDEKRRALGEPGTRVIGIAAGRAYAMAKWVAISGDPVVEAGLRKALAHMEHYRVPRGAQGWECPVLEPDVLAAAYAVRAYVWAFMALGEQRWLEKARYWARTGLPFQYAWDDGQRPGMRYASIPVFGSTFYTHSWLGLPVQWCGLVYAYALQELRRFDRNDLWRREAEGITASAVHQQWPMDNKELAGTYPDSYGQWFTHRNPVYINPEDIAVNALALHGLDPGLRSATVKLGDGLVHITAPADLQVGAEGSGLRAQLQYVPGEVFYLTVAPVQVAQATRVLAGEQALVRREALPPGEVGWAYDPQLKVLAVGLRAGGQGKAVLRIAGITRSLPELPKAAARWEFEGGSEGWAGEHNCRVQWQEGKLRIVVTGYDPYALSGPANVDAGRYKKLRARVRLTAGQQVGLFWRSSRSPHWGPDKEVHAPCPGDGQWREIVFDLSHHELWAGNILQIRLDPEPPDVPVGTVLEVDWIRPEP
jgi:hypothetical protein